MLILLLIVTHQKYPPGQVCSCMTIFLTNEEKTHTTCIYMRKYCTLFIMGEFSSLLRLITCFITWFATDTIRYQYQFQVRACVFILDFHVKNENEKFENIYIICPLPQHPQLGLYPYPHIFCSTPEYILLFLEKCLQTIQQLSYNFTICYYYHYQYQCFGQVVSQQAQNPCHAQSELASLRITQYQPEHAQKQI